MRVAALVLCLLWGSLAVAEGEDCPPWPGEPAPLPTASSPDAFLARWAALRVAELSAAAQDAEPFAPARAQRLWQHVRCLDPTNAAVVSGLERTRVVRVVHPPVVTASLATEREPQLDLSRLGAPIRFAPPPTPAPPTPAPPTPAPPTPSPPEPRATTALVPPPAAPPPRWKRIDDAIGAAESYLRGANFEAALAAAERLRSELRTEVAEGAGRRRMRTEVVAATAEIALGREDAARKSFERALVADPGLRLDPATTSPKVRRVFEAVRVASGATP